MDEENVSRNGTLGFYILKVKDNLCLFNLMLIVSFLHYNNALTLFLMGIY
jgi:hypothetical protein